MQLAELQNSRFVQIVVGAVVLFFAWQIFFGSGFFDGFVAPEPDSDGKVSASQINVATILATVLEVVATILATVGSVSIARVSGGIRWLTEALGPFLQQASTQVSAADVPVDHDNPRLAQATADLLIDAARRGDVGLTIALAERIHGTAFLRKKAEEKASAEQEAVE